MRYSDPLNPTGTCHELVLHHIADITLATPPTINVEIALNESQSLSKKEHELPAKWYGL